MEVLDMDPQLQEELLRYQVRMEALHAAITLYCCHRGAGGAHGEDVTPGQLADLLPQLMRLRDKLLETALVEGPI
jgi:hypothetical protein